MQVLSNAMQIFSLYHNAYILSLTAKNKLEEVNRLITLKETLKDIFSSLEDRSANFFLGGVIKSLSQKAPTSYKGPASSSASISSNMTPAFQSLGATPPAIPTPP
jgi:hypothetical protein